MVVQDKIRRSYPAPPAGRSAVAVRIDASPRPIPRRRARPRVGPTRRYAILKRAMDVFGAAALLVVLAPLMLFVGVVVWLDSPGPVLYAARRVGRGGRVIRVLKYRSMHVDAERRLAALLDADPARAEEYRSTFKLKRDPRLTRVGRVLRQTSLDELPQFLNVLLGHMSLVGPRPIVSAELELYAATPGAAEAYLALRPGITGLWQVSGRNDVTYAQRIAFDTTYARGCCLSADIAILARTPAAVLGGHGAY